MALRSPIPSILYIDYVRRSGQPRGLQCEPTVDHLGEWTPAMTDCATYFNGCGASSCYNGRAPTYSGSTRVGGCVGLTVSGSTFGPSYKTSLRKTWEAKISLSRGARGFVTRGGLCSITYKKASGWIMWTRRVDEADEWSYQADHTYGWISSNHTSRQQPNSCC